MTRIAAAALAAFLLAGPAVALPCESVEYVQAETAKAGLGLRFTPIDADKTQKFITHLKSMNDGFAPMQASRVGVMHRPGGALVVIITFDDKGCAFQNWPVPADYFAAIIQDKGI